MKRATEESRCEIAGNCDKAGMASKMKAALEQRSAVMDGKTCGKRKSRKNCAEDEPWEEEDRMGTGRKEGRKERGGQDQQHPLERSFYMKAV